MTEYELVSMAESIDPSKSLYGPLGEVKKHLPVTSQEFNTLEQAAVHVTEYGYCVHDYTMSPCEKFRDCINCTEQVCIKGDDVKLLRMKERLAHIEDLVSKAQKSYEEEDYGSDRWLDYQLKTSKRLKELIEILENPSIGNGAQVKLRGSDFSQLQRVAKKKSISVIDNENKKDESFILEDLTSLLGGGFG